MKTILFVIIFSIFALGTFAVVHALPQDVIPSDRDYVSYTQNYNVPFTYDGKIDYDLLIAKIMPEIFEKTLRKQGVDIAQQDIVLNRGPQIAMYTESSYNCGYVIDYANNQVYWLESAINSKEIEYVKIFTRAPTPDYPPELEIEEFNLGWCFGPLKQQVASIFLEGKSYLTDTEEGVSVAAIKHELRGNPNLNHQEFTVGKFNFDYGDAVLTFCGQFQKPMYGLGYFDGSLKNGMLKSFSLESGISPLCAIRDDAKIHSIKTNQKSDAPEDLQVWKNIRMETVFLKDSSAEKLLERNYMYPQNMHYNMFEYSTPFEIDTITFVPEKSATRWSFDMPTKMETFAKIRVPQNGGNYYMSYGPNDWNEGDITDVSILVDGVEVEYKTQTYIRAPEAPYPQLHTDYIFKIPKDSLDMSIVLFIENYVPEEVDDDEYQPYTPRE